MKYLIITFLGNYQVNVCELNHRLRSFTRTESSSRTSSLASHPLIHKLDEYLTDIPCTCGVNHLTKRSNKFGIDEYLDDVEMYLADLNFTAVVYRDGILYKLLDGNDDKFKETIQVAANEAVACGMEHDAICLNAICGK